jgi:predicted transposase YbfD/YdcC
MGKHAEERQTAKHILRHLSGVKDARVPRTRVYRLSHLLFMALCATLGGMDGPTSIALFVADRKALFERWLGRRFVRTPSHDTFGRILNALSPTLFEQALRGLLAELQTLGKALPGEVVALDGKAVRGALKRGGGTLHLLHAWACERQLLVGQVAVEKGAAGEVAALPKLIAGLQLDGAVVTVDANGATREVAEACVEAKADYVLAFKGNRGHLHQKLLSLFVLLHWQGGLPGAGGQRTQRYWRRAEAGHGRQELREAWALTPQAWPMDWPGLRSVVLVHRVRWLPGKAPQEAWHLYVSSLPAHAQRLARAIRTHWHVENRLHWALDVQMGEDRRGVRHEAGAQNLACLARLGLHLLKADKSVRLGVALKRMHAAGNPEYLGHLLTSGVSSR